MTANATEWRAGLIRGPGGLAFVQRRLGEPCFFEQLDKVGEDARELKTAMQECQSYLGAFATCGWHLRRLDAAPFTWMGASMSQRVLAALNASGAIVATDGCAYARAEFEAKR